MAFCRRSTLILRHIITYNNNNNKVIETRNIKRWVAPTLQELKRRRDKIGPESLKPRSTFLEWNYDVELFAFGKRLNEEFDKDLLRRALIHRTYVIKQMDNQTIDNKTKIDDDNLELINEGDSIITKYLNEKLNKSYPDVLVQPIVNYLTSEEMLSHVAIHMGLKDIILTAEFPIEKSTLSNSFKAIVAALNQSQNLNQVKQFLNDFLMCQLNGKDVYEIWNPKKPYQHLLNLLKSDNIEARLCNQSAINTILANYQVGLYSDRKLLGLGWGESIEIAKEMAALNAIQKIYDTTMKRNN